MPRCVERDLVKRGGSSVAVFHPDEARPLVFLTKLSVNLQACFFFRRFFSSWQSPLFFLFYRERASAKMTFVLGICCPAVRKTKGVCMHTKPEKSQPPVSMNGIFSRFCFGTSPADQRTAHPSSTEKALCVLNEVFWRRKMAVFELKGERRIWLALSCLSLASPSLCPNYSADPFFGNVKTWWADRR